VVGRDRVADDHETAGTLDVGDRFGLPRHPVEVRREPNVGRPLVPRIELALGRVEPSPALVAGEHVGVDVRVHPAPHGLADHRVDLLAARPEVAEEDVLAV
jgi:hypothetical protein